MKTKKPNWTPIEINEKTLRRAALRHETFSHDAECDCNKCMEYFGLDALLDCFTEDEMAGAVIETNKLTEAK